VVFILPLADVEQYEIPAPQNAWSLAVLFLGARLQYESKSIWRSV
jgi:hypothetical protein